MTSAALGVGLRRAARRCAVRRPRDRSAGARSVESRLENAVDSRIVALAGNVKAASSNGAKVSSRAKVDNSSAKGSSRARGRASGGPLSNRAIGRAVNGRSAEAKADERDSRGQGKIVVA